VFYALLFVVLTILASSTELFKLPDSIGDPIAEFVELTIANKVYRFALLLAGIVLWYFVNRHNLGRWHELGRMEKWNIAVWGGSLAMLVILVVWSAV
jgi:hypothetical protein